MIVYYYLSTHTLTATLTDAVGDGVTGATVSATLVALDGTEIDGQTWPLSLPDQGGGLYSATVEHDLDVAVGQRLRAQVTATKAGVQRYAEPEVIVEVDRT